MVSSIGSRPRDVDKSTEKQNLDDQIEEPAIIEISTDADDSPSYSSDEDDMATPSKRDIRENHDLILR
jgi:hypothetical protein